MEKTFSQFKEDFYGRIKDISLFDTGEYNLVKVVLDGLKVNYADKGRVRIFIQPGRIKAFLFLKRCINFFSGNKPQFSLEKIQQLKNSAPHKLLIIDPGGRMADTGSEKVSFYYGKIIQLLGRKNCIVAAEGNKSYEAGADFSIQAYNAGLLSGMELQKDDLLLLSQLNSTLDRIKSSGLFSEKENLNIAIAFQQFFIQFVSWRNILEIIKPAKVLLWPHYHREGCIAAMRKLNIPVIELQHGLIAQQDIFYVFPPLVRQVEKRALFADEIWVYGQFWKDELLKGAGYEKEAIKICGYYPFSREANEKEVKELKNIFPGKKNILVTTQTYMDEYFCRYIKFLSEDIEKRDLPYGLLVKLHPAEQEEKYKSVSGLTNVKIIKGDLETIFRAVEIHVSCYSTTLFDALRFGLKNYSFWVEQYADYIKLIAEEKVAKILQPGENPLDFPSPAEKDSVYYYEKFKDDLFRTLLS